MARSPAHYREALLHGVVETAAMRLGSLVHFLVLGGHRRFVRYDGQRRGKEWAAFEAEHAGPDVTILTATEWDPAEPMAEAVRNDPIAAPLLSGLAEGTVRWKLSGRDCRGSPDIFGRVQVDLKTTPDASPGWFTRHAMKLGYCAQAAWYADGCEAAGLAKRERVSIIAVEKKPPYAPTVFDLSERALDLGRRTYRLLFERLLACEASDQWPAYAQGPLLLDPPEDLTLQIEGEEIAV
jgi:hypothetical protein